ncbi:hypothetical protein CLAFUW4_02570 [Fulvia fulva]|uniref:Uncharacterized protein n=1 Tax=Passalora fulva TaxID=5499 RepID=A0A9Q8L9N8_PASFU|nr:uncharacterized protein CLAFUR5_02559 [Fulvia fulva]KAK4631512.1 hypothetical protein CLAFUR4_02565 [Fulvia fulva]KAK4632771.1 hypothetical protein CLAFUR0_02569 [Fulvia fulva]UJO13362.1 hypothetical protein CLAFUR5_02559 [Fulvia fulva]WPV11834.1 hypothetical protein CLAFUW4_02570 [Fulvia fulva]WPV26003.1 hypothetical protein CLAFUW7_02570 [Fulvia fulva]
MASQPRASTETTSRTRHDTTTPSRPASIAPTDTTSILTAVDDGEATPRALSLAPTLVETRTTYRGFPSEAAYRAAFHEWAESKRYNQQDDTALIGFYGETTMEELAARPRAEFGLSRKWRERKERKAQRQQLQQQQQQGRRQTMA